MDKENKQTKSKRESNIELLRIVCVLFIISSHFLGMGHVSQKEPFVYHFIYTMLTNMSRVSCSVFIIITAWFSIDKPFDIAKLFHVWLATIMYTIPFVLYGHHFALYSEDLDSVKCSFLPVTYGYGAMWFSSVYITLMLFSPLLNHIIKHIPKNVLIFFLFSYVCLLSMFGTVFHENGKYSLELVVFVFLYLLTGYIKKYLVSEGKIPGFKFSLVLFLSMWFMITALMAIGSYNAGNIYYDELYNYGYFFYGYFQTIPHLICAFGLFFFFYKMKMSCIGFINLIAKASYGIIIFHNIPGWNSYFYTEILHSQWHAKNMDGIKLLVYAIVGILFIYSVGLFLEMARQTMSNFVIEKRNWYKLLCEYINSFCSGGKELSIEEAIPLALPIVIYYISVHLVFWLKENSIIYPIPFVTVGGIIVLLFGIINLIRQIKTNSNNLMA